VLLAVEKRGANTGWVAAQLARTAGVHPRDVGYSGQKDRHAVTRSPFPCHGLPRVPWSPVSHFRRRVSCPCGEASRAQAPSGFARGNRFVIRVRDIVGEPADVDARMLQLAEAGVPNYFGPQRFGREGANLARARDWAGGDVAPRDRAQRSFALSAARSALFNSVLAERVRRGDWNQLLPGEAVILDGRRSFFPADAIDDALRERCRTLDVHRAARCGVAMPRPPQALRSGSSRVSWRRSPA